MKITVIGAGSVFFTRQLVKGLAESPALREAEVALVDVDAGICEQMGQFCRRVNDAVGGALRIVTATDRREVLAGSDFVILTFSRRNVHYRGVGAHVAQTYGILEVSGDTAGPGGVFRTLKAVPAVLEVARDVEQLCPDAWVINYVNPTNIIAKALDRYTRLKWMSFCDGMYRPVMAPRMCRYLGIEATLENWNKLDIRAAGINHLIWMTGLKLDGEDVFDRFVAGLKQAAREDGPSSDTRAEWDLTETFGAWPTVIWHTKEYIRYFQGRGSRPQRDFTVRKWDLNERIRWMRHIWKEIEDVNAGRIAPGEARSMMVAIVTDMVAQVIEAVATGRPQRLPVNLRNDGRISNLPDDCIIETFGTIGADGADAPAFGPLPPGPRGMIYSILDEQDLALEAASSGDYDLLVRAVACDPLVMSLTDARAITRDFMATDADDLPPIWHSYWEGPDHDLTLDYVRVPLHDQPGGLSAPG